MEWMLNGKPTGLGVISGAVAGLVAIPLASGFVTPMATVVIRLLAGGLCYVLVAKVKAAMGYDDSLEYSSS